MVSYWFCLFLIAGGQTLLAGPFAMACRAGAAVHRAAAGHQPGAQGSAIRLTRGDFTKALSPCYRTPSLTVTEQGVNYLPLQSCACSVLMVIMMHPLLTTSMTQQYVFVRLASAFLRVCVLCATPEAHLRHCRGQHWGLLDPQHTLDN